MLSVTTIIALGLDAPANSPPANAFNPQGYVMSFPLPWRKVTPLHTKLGVRAQRFAYTATQATPTPTVPQAINLRYDASTAIDRIVGFTLSVGSGGAACEFLIQELNTGWFLDYSLPGTKAVYLSANIETLPDEVSLQFSFSANVGALVYLSFQNIEIVAHRIGA